MTDVYVLPYAPMRKVCAEPCGMDYTGPDNTSADMATTKAKWAAETSAMNGTERRYFSKQKLNCAARCGMCKNYPKAESGASVLAMGAALVAATVALM